MIIGSRSGCDKQLPEPLLLLLIFVLILQSMAEWLLSLGI